MIAPGKTFVVPPATHSGHTVTIEREDEVSVDRWICRCSCGEEMKLPGYILEALIDRQSEPTIKPDETGQIEKVGPDGRDHNGVKMF